MVGKKLGYWFTFKGPLPEGKREERDLRGMGSFSGLWGSRRVGEGKRGGDRNMRTNS